MESWVEELEKKCEITCRTWTTTIHFYRKLICVWFNDCRKFQQHGFVSRYLKWCTLWQEANHVTRVIYNLILGVVTIVTADSFGTPSILWWESSSQLGLPGLPVPQVTIQTVSSLRPIQHDPTSTSFFACKTSVFLTCWSWTQQNSYIYILYEEPTYIFWN